jgi:hypothetical protein
MTRNTRAAVGYSAMAELTHLQYDALERAIANGRRIVVYRRGTEYVVVPTRLQVIDGREAVEAVHPTTGEQITLFIDEVDSIDVVG